jgi:predicted nucleotidyltransferase
VKPLLSGRLLRRIVLLRRRKVLRMAQRLDIASIWLVGSVARGEATQSSDLDFYVDRADPLTLHLLEGWLTFFGRPVHVIHSTTLIMREDEFTTNVFRDAIPLHKGGGKPNRPVRATSKEERR